MKCPCSEHILHPEDILWDKPLPLRLGGSREMLLRVWNVSTDQIHTPAFISEPIRVPHNTPLSPESQCHELWRAGRQCRPPSTGISGPCVCAAQVSGATLGTWDWSLQRLCSSPPLASGVGPHAIWSGRPGPASVFSHTNESPECA